MTEPILGIDLGTTNSLVGVVDSGFPILLADSDGHRITPSAVFYPEASGKSVAGGSIAAAPLIGRPALRARAAHPDRVITSAKRLIGRRMEEIDHVPAFPIVGSPSEPARIGIAGRPLLPEEVSAEILSHLAAIATERLGTPVRKAVITVPAYFNDAQRNATKRAGESAGLEVVRILNEPTAAALAYGLDKLEDHSRVAVYDLGGGTFDISILELHEGVFEVKATHGDTQLGGDDIDRALAEWLQQQSAAQHTDPALTADPTVATRFLEAAEAAKIALSEEHEHHVSLPFYDGVHTFETTVTRTTLEALAQPLLARTRRACALVLSDAGLQPEDLDAVVLVGGTTRMPAVRRLVADIFGQQPDLSQHPDEAVALGAVIQGGILSGNLQKMILLDITPLSLGIETFGGLMNIILPRNTTIPAKAGELFTNAVAGQQAMAINILQGEREMAADNWRLGQIEIPFTPGPKASARVGVQFTIDENGILEVLCRDTATNTDHILEIRDSAVDVDDTQVEKMITASVEHAFDDMEERIWTEARLKAEELLPAVDQALAGITDDDLPEHDRADITTKAAIVAAILDEDHHDSRKLKAAVAELDAATQELAVILLSKAMDNA